MQNNNKINIIKKQINKKTNDIASHRHDIKLKNIRTNTWFTIKSSNIDKNHNTTNLNLKLELLLNDNQKNMIDEWLLKYKNIFNVASKYIYDNYNNIDINYHNIKEKINNSIIEIINSTVYMRNDLYSAIKLACMNWRDCKKYNDKINLIYPRISQKTK